MHCTLTSPQPSIHYHTGSSSRCWTSMASQQLQLTLESDCTLRRWMHSLSTGKHPCNTFSTEPSVRATPYPASSSSYTSMLFSLTSWLHTLPLPTKLPHNMSS